MTKKQILTRCPVKICCIECIECGSSWTECTDLCNALKEYLKKHPEYKVARQLKLDM